MCTEASTISGYGGTSDRDETDFLLSASLFQKSAAQLFSDDKNNPVGAYFSSLWVQEFPSSNASMSCCTGYHLAWIIVFRFNLLWKLHKDVSLNYWMKRVEQIYCPFCGTSRDAQNTRVRIKSRKRQTKALARSLGRKVSKSIKRNSNVATTTSTAIDEKHIGRFAKSKNRLTLYCNSCHRSCTQPGLPRDVQKNILSPSSRTSSVYSDNTAQPALSAFLSRIASASSLHAKTSSPKIVSYSAPCSPSPSASSKKRRKKDANAGLIVPPSLLKKTLPVSQNKSNDFGGNLLERFLC
ncbi:UPF0711 protein C18orf21 homolog [Paramacrobiotus metropolitanus]|uniref:UPF0711 protein C18orf21 homolog n=1 Tax=Paramacrobiotus metropolitanus TaxID=2943436 RepID=UPI00244634BA|nr:UPF0711 protein C18orf21 homolog [Paramacrobiotus metropolitanus]